MSSDQANQQNAMRNELHCLGGNPAFQFCINEQCRQTPVFTCARQICNCQDRHSFCSRGSVEKTLKAIRQKLEEKDYLHQQIEDFLELIIDTIREFRNKLIREVDEKMEFSMLFEVEEKFFNKAQNNQLQSTSLSSSQTALLWSIVKEKKYLNTDIYGDIKRKIWDFQYSISQLTQKTRSEVFKLVDERRRPLTQLNLSEPILKASNILIKGEQVQRLVQFFPERVAQLQLVFQASENNFRMDEYYSKCGSMTNTVIIALTDKGKKFGGFSPCCFWNGSKGYVADHKKRSFLFSLSKDEKFELENPKRGIYRYRSRVYAIRFGSDFIICDKADKNGENQVGSQKYYKNGMFKNDKQSYLRLNGNETPDCALREWEVFKVVFET